VRSVDAAGIVVRRGVAAIRVRCGRRRGVAGGSGRRRYGSIDGREGLEATVLGEVRAATASGDGAARDEHGGEGEGVYGAGERMDRVFHAPYIGRPDPRVARIRRARVLFFRATKRATFSTSMALEMRPACERCQAALAPDGPAFICSYECSFCATCAETMKRTCPNCGGELVPRPRRVRREG
jgi:hypothetical protein